MSEEGARHALHIMGPEALEASDTARRVAAAHNLTIHDARNPNPRERRVA